MKLSKNTTYNGGKNGSGTYQQIINLMPPHDLYFEMFYGSGAIDRRKKTANIMSFGFDLDRSVTDHYSDASEKSAGTNIINMDAISFIEHFHVLDLILKTLGVSCMIYLDPPYLMTTRKGGNKKLYKYELSDNDHIRILNAIRRISQSYVMISAYKNTLYDDMLSDWSTHSFTATTRNGTATETLYMNYPKPDQLHDYSYIGDDYRERERLQGIKKRMVSKFERMNKLERNCLLKELNLMNNIKPVELIKFKD